MSVRVDLWTPRQSVALVVLLAALFALVGRGTFFTSDEGGEFNTGLALVRTGSPAVAPGESIHPGVDGRYYACREILPTLATIPLSLAGLALEVAVRHTPPPVAPTGGRLDGTNWLIFANVTLLGPLTIALTLLWMHTFMREEGASGGDALWVVLAAAWATPLAVYSKTIFSQVFETAWLMLALLQAVRWRRTGAAGSALGVGIACGLGVMSRAASPAAPALAVYLVLAGPWSWRQRVRAMLLFGLPVALGAVAVGWWNRLRWGSPWDFGYHGDNEVFNTPPWQGLYGLLASPGKGLLIYAPVLLLPIVFARALWQRGRAEVLLLLAITASYLALYCRWYDWPGGLAWGPRFLLALVPAWLVLLPRAFAGPHGGWARRLLCVTLAMGLVVQALGLALHPKWVGWLQADCFALNHSDLVVSWQVLRERGPDDLWLWAAPGAARPAYCAITLLLLAAVVWGGAILWRRAAAGRERAAVTFLLLLAGALVLGSFFVSESVPKGVLS